MKARCIAHIDLDCFYAQVEALRLQIDCNNEPFVLVQWGNLIAVNYVARGFGISRFMNIREALEKCSSLKYGHVPTYLIGESEYKYHANPKKATHKVSLDPYRQASANIFDLIERFCSEKQQQFHPDKKPNITIEKGGIDEVFLDLTEFALGCFGSCVSNQSLIDETLAVSKLIAVKPGDVLEFVRGLNLEFRVIDLLSRAQDCTTCQDREDAGGCTCPCHSFPELVQKLTDPLQQPVRLTEIGSVRTGSLKSGMPLEPESVCQTYRTFVEQAQLLFIGAKFVHELRCHIREKLGLNTSAGIAGNKMLAKCISAAFKPNQQTVLLPWDTLSFLCGFGMRKLRGFGGKLGHSVAELCLSKLQKRRVLDLQQPQPSAMKVDGKEEAEEEPLLFDESSQSDKDDDGPLPLNSSMLIEQRQQPQQQVVLPVASPGSSVEAPLCDHQPPPPSVVQQSISSCTSSTICCGLCWSLSVHEFNNVVPTSSEPEAEEGLPAARSISSANHSSMHLGEYIYFRLRGVCHAEVCPRILTKSLMAEKMFSPPTDQIEGVEKWLRVLAGELVTRYSAFSKKHSVFARNFNVRFRSADPNLDELCGSKTLPVPYCRGSELDEGSLVEAAKRHAMHLMHPPSAALQRALDGPQHCNMTAPPLVKKLRAVIGVTLSLSDFKPQHPLESVRGGGTQQRTLFDLPGFSTTRQEDPTMTSSTQQSKKKSRNERMPGTRNTPCKRGATDNNSETIVVISDDEDIVVLL